MHERHVTVCTIEPRLQSSLTDRKGMCGLGEDETCCWSPLTGHVPKNDFCSKGKFSAILGGSFPRQVTLTGTVS